MKWIDRYLVNERLSNTRLPSNVFRCIRHETSVDASHLLIPIDWSHYHAIGEGLNR